MNSKLIQQQQYQQQQQELSYNPFPVNLGEPVPENAISGNLVSK